MIFADCSLTQAGEVAAGAPSVSRVAGFQRPIAGRVMSVDGREHDSRPLLEVYRGRRWKRQRNRRDGETKVTRAFQIWNRAGGPPRQLIVVNKLTQGWPIPPSLGGVGDLTSTHRRVPGATPCL